MTNPQNVNDDIKKEIDVIELSAEQLLQIKGGNGDIIIDHIEI